MIGHEHRLFVAGLELLLAREFDIVGTVYNLTSLPEAVLSLRPDLVVQGLSNTPQLGLEIVSRIRESMPGTPIVVVTIWAEATIAAEAFRRGASAYIPETSSAEELLVGIRAAISGVPYVPATLAGAALASLAASTLDPPEDLQLTSRQRDVVRLLAEGKSMKEVASTLELTPRAVAFHKYKVMHTFQIKSSAELVRFAMKRGLV